MEQLPVCSNIRESDNGFLQKKLGCYTSGGSGMVISHPLCFAILLHSFVLTCVNEMASARLRSVVMMVRDLQRSARFFEEGLGLQVRFANDFWAEVQCGHPSASLLLKQAEREACATAGYSPFLNFDVDDLDSALTKLVSLGGVMDGPVKYPLHGKCAAIRTIDGQMIGLHEPSKDN
eukprot:m.67463 g.67463  ORF g.67463 m.67463 type:complete len:177 (+) comp35450_c0_seq1:586-1116(+)